MGENIVEVTDVAPFTGAWIEIRLMMLEHLALMVAPFTGAWIEIKALKSCIL